MIGRLFVVLFIAFLVSFSSCVTERVDQYDNGEDFLNREIAKIIGRLPYQSGDALVSDLLRLIAFEDFAVEPMLLCLKEDNEKVQSSAAYVLGQLQAREAIEPLMDLTETESKLLKYEAARAVLEIGAWNTIPILFEGLDDESPYIRTLCIDALSRHTGETFGYLSDGDEQERKASIVQWKTWWDFQINSSAIEGNLVSR